MVLCCDLEWERRPKSSSCPLDSSFEAVIFVHHVLKFFPIFRSCYDLILPEFESIPGDEFLGIDLYQVKFDLCKVWEPILLI